MRAAASLHAAAHMLRTRFRYLPEAICPCSSTSCRLASLLPTLLPCPALSLLSSLSAAACTATMTGGVHECEATTACPIMLHGNLHASRASVHQTMRVHAANTNATRLLPRSIMLCERGAAAGAIRLLRAKKASDASGHAHDVPARFSVMPNEQRARGVPCTHQTRLIMLMSFRCAA